MTSRPAPRERRDMLLSRVTVALVAWGVLAFGAVYGWAYTPLYTGVALVGVAALLRCWWRGQRHITARLRGLSAALVITTAAVAVQLVPVPAGWIAGSTPDRHAFLRDYSLSYALADSGARQAEPADRSWTHPLSVRPDLTRRGLGFLVALSLLMVGLAAALKPQDVRRVAIAVAALGVLVAMIALIQRSTGTSRIYGLWTPEVGHGGFGPFVNKNHFAGWMLMVIPLSVGLWCGMVAEAMRGARAGWRERILWLSSTEANRVVLVGVGLVIMGLSLVLSLSRSGITCLALAIGGLVWVALKRQHGLPRRTFSVAYLTFTFVVALGWAGFDAVARRFAEARWHDIGGRLGIWEDTVRIVRDFWPFGSGLNTYGQVMFEYQTHELQYHFVQAHNEYLQLAAEGGLLVGLPILTLGVVLAREAAEGSGTAPTIG